MKHGAFILARYSTDRQNEDTIEVQVEKCSAWCQEHGLPVLDVFADMAVSGMKDSRPQYNRMMEDLRQGRADTVVIYDQSRMFRKMTAWFEFRDQMEIMCVRVVSVTQPTIGGDLRDPSNFLIEGSMALFNQMWVLQTRQKVTEKMYHMARAGQHTGGIPPLGYKVENGALAVDEQEAETVRKIFAWYAAGRSYREIIAELNMQGLRTKAGNTFGSNSLHDLLKNEKYVGVLVYGQTRKRPDGKRNSHASSADALRIAGGCPAIVDQETFDRVQQRLQENKRRSGRPIQHEQPLKGKVFCGECKHAMSVFYSGRRAADGHKNAYYACSGKQRLHNCDMLPIRKDTLEQWTAQVVREQFIRMCNYDTLADQIRRTRDEILGGAGPQLQSIVKRYQDVTRQLERATDAVLGGLNSETLAAKIQALEDEKKRLDQRAKLLKKSVENATHSDDEIQQLVDQIQDLATGSDADVLKLVVRVEVYVDTLRIWTIIDDPSWTNADTEKAEPKTVQHIAPITNTSDCTHNSRSQVTGTINYTQGQIIIAICVPRPAARRKGDGG